MKNNDKLTKSALIAGIWAGALGLTSSAYAVSTFTIDGIDIGYSKKLKKAVNNFETMTLYESTVAKKGDKLDGIGFVNSIKSPQCGGAGGLCWQNLDTFGGSKYELTYRFSDFLVQKIKAIDTTNALVWFSSGIVTMYADSTPDFNQTGNATGATGHTNSIASATDGAIWLNLTGAPTGTICAVADACFSGVGTKITLESTFKYAGSLASVQSGNGFGFLNVNTALSGAANSYFNTDFFPQSCPGCGPMDLAFNSSFQKDLNNGTGKAKDKWPVSGSGNLRQNTITIATPEPGSLLLLGTGILGFFMFRRRRQTA